MAIGSFSPPKGWEDWATLVLGILLWAIPIILQFKEPAVLLNFLIVGFLVICVLFPSHLGRADQHPPGHLAYRFGLAPGERSASKGHRHYFRRAPHRPLAL